MTDVHVPGSKGYSRLEAIWNRDGPGKNNREVRDGEGGKNSGSHVAAM